jgi:hypothetical protein
VGSMAQTFSKRMLGYTILSRGVMYSKLSLGALLVKMFDECVNERIHMNSGLGLEVLVCRKGFVLLT